MAGTSEIETLIRELIKDNSTGFITPARLRQVLNTINASMVNLINAPFTIEQMSVLPAALSTCGSIPVNLRLAVPATRFPIFAVTTRYIFGSEEYDFSSPIVIKYAGAPVSNFFMNEDLNALADYCKFYGRQGDYEVANTNIVLTTEDGSNPTQGNGTLVLKLYYGTDTF